MENEAFGRTGFHQLEFKRGIDPVVGPASWGVRKNLLSFLIGNANHQVPAMILNIENEVGGQLVAAHQPAAKFLIDGDGGDENLKDYPIEENPELTIRSVINNRMLYQEGWGVGRIKHSLTYSGGLSRGYLRTYAPARHHGFAGFSPFTRPNVIEVAEGIPFTALTDMSVEKLYSLKGEIVSRGVKAVTGLDMPVQRVVRRVHAPAGEPPVEGRPAVIQSAVRSSLPGHCVGRGHPE